MKLKASTNQSSTSLQSAKRLNEATVFRELAPALSTVKYRTQKTFLFNLKKRRKEEKIN